MPFIGTNVPSQQHLMITIGLCIIFFLGGEEGKSHRFQNEASITNLIDANKKGQGVHPLGKIDEIASLDLAIRFDYKEEPETSEYGVLIKLLIRCPACMFSFL